MNISRVFILASRPLFAEGVQSLLSGQPGIEVVGVATADPDGLAQVQAATPDVVVIEARGKEQSRLVAQVLGSIPDAKVVGLSVEDNHIHTYYQQSKQGHRVQDLLDTIREPMSLHGRSPKTLRLFVLYQGHYGERILENIQRHAPGTWNVESWCAPSNLPLVVDDPLSFLPAHLPAADLVLSLGESGSAAQLLPGIVERTSARALIAPVDNVDWLPDGLIRQLRVWMAAVGVTTVFPKPFCSLTENCYNVRQQEVAFEDPWIAEFARHFGRPVFRVACDGQDIAQITVERDTACGCARFVAQKLAGGDVQEAAMKAGLLHHHYPCRATMRVDPGLGEPSCARR